MPGMSDETPFPAARALTVVPWPGDAGRVERGFWRTVRRTAGRVPFVDDAVAAYYCAIDAKTPTRVPACCWRRSPISSCRPT